jgi:hypothetical protein
MNNDGTPAMRAVGDLINTGAWFKLPGPPSMVILMHAWDDESVDTLALHSETDALAERTNPDGEPVWRHNGTVTEVIDALRQLPAPYAPDAPHEPLVDTPNHNDREIGTP